MLRAVGLSNFKAFGEGPHVWPMARLTCLCGPNASGKSSVIQSLLALRQSIEANLDDPATPLLITEGSVTSLGSFGDVVYGHDLSREMSLVTAVELNEPDMFGVVTLAFENLEFQGESSAWGGTFTRSFAEPALSGITVAAFRTSVSEPLFSLDVGTGAEDRYYGYFMDAEGAVAFHPSLHLGDLRFEGGEFSFAAHRFGPGMYATWPAEWGDSSQDTDGRIADEAVYTVEPGELAEAEWDDLLENPSTRTVIGFANHVLSAVENELTQISYIGPQREVPQRYYPQNEKSPGRLTRIDKPTGWREALERGSYEHQTYWAESEEWVAKNLLPPGSDATTEPGRLDQLLGEWLRYLGLPDVVPTLEGRDMRLLARSAYADDCLVSLTDTGYGVSQVLPILVQGLTLTGGTLILDQPELHLHPRLQTGIADFVLMVARENGSVIVETHSDHFINRVVRRVVEGSVSKEDVAVHFFTPTVDGPHVEQVDIDPTFGIRNWPLGFFDQYADEQEAVIRASLRRRTDEERQ